MTDHGEVGVAGSLMCVAKTPDLRNRLRRIFSGADLSVDFEPNLDRVLERFESHPYEVLLVTSVALKAGNVDGSELLDVILARSPGTKILFLAEQRDLKLAMSWLAGGAYQYAKLPIADEELRLLVRSAFDSRLPGAVAKPRGKKRRGNSLEAIVGKTPVMRQLSRQIRQAAGTDMPVLLTGETGTGKDLVAEAIHRLGPRTAGPFVPVHLGACPPELVAGELFGHEKGAFTGALDRQPGRFEEAQDGTLFLDEIGTADEKMQIALLRVLERNSYRRLGGRRAVRTNARIVAATNEDLEEAVGAGTFRQDLYYRLDVLHINLPPLRDRHGDIPVLVDHFLKRYNRHFEKEVTGVAPECITLLEASEWPGNVRELKNVIQRAVLVCRGEVILPQHLPARFRSASPTRPKVVFQVGTPLHEVEREMVVRALMTARNNRTRAAQLLGISRRALYNKLRKYGI